MTKSGIYTAGDEREWSPPPTRPRIAAVLREHGATDEPGASDRQLRFARMRDALRMIEGEFRVLAEDNGSNAHALRVGRAHALAIIDLIDDVSDP